MNLGLRRNSRYSIFYKIISVFLGKQWYLKLDLIIKQVKYWYVYFIAAYKVTIIIYKTGTIITIVQIM